MNRISKVGFEVEGGWNGTTYKSPFDDISLIADHSINGQTLGSSRKLGATHVGELVSPPFDYVKEDWPLWLHQHWPNAAPKDRTNRTCGFHIHTSYLSMRDYSLLSSKAFLFSLLDRMNELGKQIGLAEKHIFWERMNGFNTFCSLDFDPGKQMNLKTKGTSNKTRYGYLNFAWNIHGTMEFRALPTFRDSQVALRFATTFFDQINSFLESSRNLPLKRSAKELSI